MDTIFYRDTFKTPEEVNAQPITIQPSEIKNINPFLPEEKSDNYLCRFSNSERNSRTTLTLPEEKIWEIKWKSILKSDSAPWFLLSTDDRIVFQNESGWQLFNHEGVLISEGIKAEGEIFIDKKENIFYVNDPSGYLLAVDLLTGDEKFYVYPFLGKGFERSVIFSNGNQIINKASELPEMTHGSPIKNPDRSILEIIDLGNSKDINEDGILTSAYEKNNLLINTGRVISAVHDSTIVIAVTDHIYFISSGLEILKDFTGNFLPLELSLDEQLRIYLLAKLYNEEDKKNVLWIIDNDGNLISESEIEALDLNFTSPPYIDFNHNVFISYKDKIVAVDYSGKILWEKYIKKPLAGLLASPNYLLAAEGNVLTAFDKEGERKFIYNFDEDLAAAPLLTEDYIFAVSANHLYCLGQKNK